MSNIIGLKGHSPDKCGCVCEKKGICGNRDLVEIIRRVVIWGIFSLVI